MVELLSPAGNFEKLKIALEYGADALYGGVSHFSLRNRSGKEFTYESFKEAVDYTHSKGKKLYATVNGFPFNSQIKLLKEHIKKLKEIKPDAFIVSTLGVIEICREIAPEIDLHLSTQANVLNYLDAKIYHRMGVKRIIAAREISLNDLKEIKKEVPELELEIFIHGSMCFAFSGRCLISSVQSGRVPNRGSCANDCRFDYEMYIEKDDKLERIDDNTIYIKSPEHESYFKLEEYSEGTYLLNAKDLNLSSYVDKILESGVVDSLKIEGRTKSPYYTAITTKTYKRAIEDFYQNRFDSTIYQNELNTLKNRGFSDGYLIHRPNEKLDTQNHLSAISEGTYQVVAEIDESGEFLMCKYKIYPNESFEIVLPNDNIELDLIQNEIGEIYKSENSYFIKFHKILTKDNKELQSVHSGNINPIKLPISLPKFSFLRIKVDIS